MAPRPLDLEGIDANFDTSSPRRKGKRCHGFAQYEKDVEQGRKSTTGIVIAILPFQPRTIVADVHVG